MGDVFSPSAFSPVRAHARQRNTRRLLQNLAAVLSPQSFLRPLLRISRFLPAAFFFSLCAGVAALVSRALWRSSAARRPCNLAYRWRTLKAAPLFPVLFLERPFRRQGAFCPAHARSEGERSATWRRPHQAMKRRTMRTIIPC